MEADPPRVESPEVLECLLSGLKHDLDASGARYLWNSAHSHCLKRRRIWDRRTLSVCTNSTSAPSLETLFRGFHKDCVQRKILRAGREALSYAEGRSESLLNQFYALLVLTRQRQQLVPQPRSWFRNLIACMGDTLKIRVASNNGHPVAAILTLRYRDTLVYQYRCSDKSFSHLGGMQVLFWKAIEEAKRSGLSRFDLGRSDWDNPGLLAFKDRWGASRSVLAYWRYGDAAVLATPAGRRDSQKRIFAAFAGYLPSCLPVA